MLIWRSHSGMDDHANIILLTIANICWIWECYFSGVASQVWNLSFYTGAFYIYSIRQSIPQVWLVFVVHCNVLQLDVQSVRLDIVCTLWIVYPLHPLSIPPCNVLQTPPLSAIGWQTAVRRAPRFLHPQFQTDVTKPMLIDQIADHNVTHWTSGTVNLLMLQIHPRIRGS